MKLVLKYISIFIIAAFLSISTCLADYDEGLKAYKDKDYKTALKEFMISAKEGDAGAQFYLGFMYGDGKGVTQHYKEAVKWYRKAAEQGFSNAQHNLGFMYSNGKGVVQSYKEAVRWYRKAADQGFSNAQHNLGLMYYNGKGVVQNYIKAHMYWNLAARQGNKSSKRTRAIVEKKMTARQIAKAQELAGKWRVKR